MKALVKYGKGENDIELREIPEPIPQANEVKVKVEATGICGTDLYGYSALKPPVVLGHETAAISVVNVNFARAKIIIYVFIVKG